MAKYINSLGIDLNNVYVSPALRAQDTIKRIFAYLQQLQKHGHGHGHGRGIENAKHQPLATNQAHWHTVQQLYTFNSEVLKSFLQTQSPHCRTITLVGHNPALTDLCNSLANDNIDNIPTCGYVQLVAKGDFAWPDIQNNSFSLQDFCTPKTRQQREVRL